MHGQDGIVYLYFFQIYYDFAGYSDIAIGLSMIFGFSFKENFNYLYISQSITEFWRRWHISLGTWFREYVYIPLGGNRKGNVYVNLFVVFIITGIWHGANWTFLIWGMVNGVIMIIERLISNYGWYKKIPCIIKWMCTMFVIFLLWIIFRADNVSDALRQISELFSISDTNYNFTWKYYYTNKIIILLLIAVIGAIGCIIPTKITKSKYLNYSGVVIFKKIFTLILFVLSIIFVVNMSYSPFLYFQF